jgi:hypothetical protein
MLEDRRAAYAISDAVRTLAEPRALTAFGFYAPGVLAGIAVAEGSPDLLNTATLGLDSAAGWGELETMGLCGGDL